MHISLTIRSWVKAADCDDWGDRTVAELIEAVLSIEVLPGVTWSPEAVGFMRLAQQLCHHCDQEENAPNYEKHMREQDALSDRVSELARGVLTRRPQTWADIIARAAIVAHCLGHDLTALSEVDRRYLSDWASEDLAISLLQMNPPPAEAPVNAVPCR